MKRFQNQKGLSLIEVTIMLLVLMLLTGVLAPSIMDFVNDAKWVKVKEDCEAISLSITRLTRDVGCVVETAGAFPGSLVTQRDNCKYDWNGASIPSVLYSAGNVPDHAGLLAAGAVDATFPASLNWSDANSDNHSDTLEHQLVTNYANYPQPPDGAALPVGPQFNIGWRGAYLGSPIGPDPWGSAYLVNSVYLNVPTGGVRHNYDTFCISGGPNGQIQTPFMQAGATSFGDDFITIISGGTY